MGGGKMRFGFPIHVWETAKSEARDVMISRAKKKGTIAYSDLVGLINSVKLEPRDLRLFHLLGEISTAEDEAGRGMLTVLVVHKSGDMQPGPGFYELAKALGRDTSDLVECWINELQFVFNVWSRR